MSSTGRDNSSDNNGRVGNEKARPSVSPVAEGFRSLIEREIERSRRSSASCRVVEGHDELGSAAAASEQQQLSALPSDVINAFEPQMQQQGVNPCDADLQAFATLLASKLMHVAAADSREETTQLQQQQQQQQQQQEPQVQQGPVMQQQQQMQLQQQQMTQQQQQQMQQ